MTHLWANGEERVTIPKPLRAVIQRLYARSVGPSRKHHVLQPVPYLPALDAYVGSWVALKDGKVRAAAPTSVKLAEELHRKNIQGATIEFVEPATTAERVGLG